MKEILIQVWILSSSHSPKFYIKFFQNCQRHLTRKWHYKCAKMSTMFLPSSLSGISMWRCPNRPTMPSSLFFMWMKFTTLKLSRRVNQLKIKLWHALSSSRWSKTTVEFTFRRRSWRSKRPINQIKKYFILHHSNVQTMIYWYSSYYSCDWAQTFSVLLIF